MQIRQAIVDPDADHTLVAHTKHTSPKVGTPDIDKEYATTLVVDRAGFRIRLYKKLKLVKTYPIAVGMAGLETPAGLYHIQNKAVNPAWHVPNSDWAGSLAGQVIPGGAPNNPIKARWLGVYDGVGVHGTSDDASIGSNASHGCIRMHIPDVEELYDDVPVGAPIYIA
jgi:lipoprotein-anchoring transpeptidase ErfK/SrfK